MELSERYVYAVYREQSFSAAAKTLFISQPALSATVKKAEKTLGFSVFDRTKNQLSLTPQGKIYIEYLEGCMENERIMKTRIDSLSGKGKETVLIGGGNFLSRALLPRACREFCRRTRGVGVKIDMGENSAKHQIAEKLQCGLLDIALSYTFDPKEFIGIPLHKETYFLAMREDLAGAEAFLPFSVRMDDILGGTLPFSKEMVNYEIPKNFPLLRSGTTPPSQVPLESYINRFSDANCHVVNCRSLETHYDMMLEGLGATIVTDVVIALKQRESERVLFVPVNAPINTRTAYVMYKRGKVLSEGAKGFASVLVDLCKNKQRLLNELAK